MKFNRHLLFTLANGALLLPSVAMAQLTNVREPTAVQESGFRTLGQVLSRGFDIVIVVSGIAFVGLLLLGGVRYLASFGNDDATKQARQIMLDATIGLVIVLIAWAVGNYVLDLLNVRIQVENPNVQ